MPQGFGSCYGCCFCFYSCFCFCFYSCFYSYFYSYSYCCEKPLLAFLQVVQVLPFVRVQERQHLPQLALETVNEKCELFWREEETGFCSYLYENDCDFGTSGEKETCCYVYHRSAFDLKGSWNANGVEKIWKEGYNDPFNVNNVISSKERYTSCFHVYHFLYHAFSTFTPAALAP